MNCLKDMTPLIVAYGDDELDGKTRRAVEDHLENCEECRNTYREIEQSMELLSGYLDNPLSEEKSTATVTPEIFIVSCGTRRKLAWAAVLIAAITLAMFYFPDARITSQAHAAMNKIATQLKSVSNFTATFEKSFSYDRPRSSGYNLIKTNGTIVCVLMPEPKLRCDETWRYFDPEGKELDFFGKTHSWAQSGNTITDKIVAGNEASQTQSISVSTSPDQRQIFEISASEKILPATPRLAAFELKRILSSFGGDGYGKWFGRQWDEFLTERDGAKTAYTFVHTKGDERWSMTVRTKNDSLHEIEMAQHLVDSGGGKIGLLVSRYRVTSVNDRIDEKSFEINDSIDTGK